jgi:hypothetical protein
MATKRPNSHGNTPLHAPFTTEAPQASNGHITTLDETADDEAKEERTPSEFSPSENTLPSLSLLQRLKAHAQDYAEDLGETKELGPIVVRKPAPDDWVRVYPDPDWRIDAFILDSKMTRQTYLILNVDLQRKLEAKKQGRPMMLYYAIERSGQPFLWPVSAIFRNGTLNTWNNSATRAVQRAQDIWVQIASNRAREAYDMTTSNKIPPPIWPDLTFEAVLEQTFEGRIIESEQHEIIQYLWGEG